jgi:hypothetical protein
MFSKQNNWPEMFVGPEEYGWDQVEEYGENPTPWQRKQKHVATPNH